MRLRLFCAAALAAVCVPCFATPVFLTPGSAATPGAGTYGGTLVDTVNGTNHGGTVSYTDSVYADPNNPLCGGCFEFVIQLQNVDVDGITSSVTTSNFDGNKYTLEAAYEDESSAGEIAPYSVSESANGKQVTFDDALILSEMSDPLIIYTNAEGDKTGSVTITELNLILDPPAFAPSGAAVTAVTPEPSSLFLLSTGALGVAGIVRRRMA